MIWAMVATWRNSRFRFRDTLGRRASATVGAAFGSLAATFGGQLAILVTGVLSARVLGPENRGHVALIIVVASVICGIVPLGAGSAVTYFVAKNHDQARNIVEDMVAPVLLQICLILLSQMLVLWLLFADRSRELQIAGIVSLGVGPATIMWVYGLAVIQGLRLYRSYNILRLLPVTSYAVLLILVFAAEGMNVITTLGAWTAANILSAIIIITVMVRSLPSAEPISSPVKLSEILRFGAKGFLGTASPLETFRIDQLIIGLFISPVALGMYAASIAYTSSPRVVAQSLAHVAVPHIASQRDQARSRRVMWKFFVVATALSLALALALIVSADFLVPFVFGPSFQGAVLPAKILLGSSVLFGGRRILAESLRGMGHAGAGAIGEVVSWIALFISLGALAPRWELIGVAVSLVVAAGVSYAVVLISAMRLKTGHAIAVRS